MKPVIFAILALALTGIASGGGGHTVRSQGVALTIPAGWHRVPPASDGPVTDPRTLIVVGTAGATPKATHCQIASYRVPASGAVVVIVGWKTATSGGGHMNPGRWPLKAMTSVHRPSFECFSGRGTAASLTLSSKAYQVNVMVGETASAQRVTDALKVGRSFRLAP